VSETTGNALLSVYDKTGIEEFARGLTELKWRIYASGGTAEALTQAGIDVTDVRLLGGAAILAHKVAAGLTREVSAGLLAYDEEAEELAELGIPRIDLLCVDMYPLEAEIGSLGATEQSVRDKTDIGGPTMLRAAAKGRRIVLSHADQRQPVLDWLRAGRPDEVQFRRQLAADAELAVADYVLKSAKYLGGEAVTGFVGRRRNTLRYGENPQQDNAGLYVELGNNDPLSLGNFELRSGAELSHTNLSDIDRMLQTATHMAAVFDINDGDTPPMALGAKHGNLCGAGVGDTLEEAVQKMLVGNKLSIFGGAVMLNGPITKEIAEILIHYEADGGKRLLDVVVASAIDQDAVEVLQRKHGKLRVVTNPALAGINCDSLDKAQRFRHVRGGMLRQDNYDFVLDMNAPQMDRHGQPLSQEQIRDMQLAWAIGCTSNSNTITLVKDGMLIGNGVGQQDRVSAAELAVKRARDAGHDINGAVAYSDSFFPFPDGPMVLAEAGVAAIFASRGSVKDAVVAKALTDAGVSFYTMPDLLVRGFYGH
jgi:phosphoribosylaminoimidazolecarboxamide formyltransferase/IMP cyclohydrolase